MNDKSLKDIWSKVEKAMGSSEYGKETIEKFISKRSHSTAQKVKNMIYIDIAVKSVVFVLLGMNVFLYMGTSNVIAVCATAMVLLVSLILIQNKMANRFSKVADYGQSTREKLASMLTYLRSRFFSTLLAISSTYPFLFISGMLLYFYAEYGQVRPLDGQDIIVFSFFLILGLGFNLYINRKQIAYQIKHLETCLSDLNDNSLEIVSKHVEMQRKQDVTIKILLMLVLVFGFVLLIVILKNIGFLVR